MPRPRALSDWMAYFVASATGRTGNVRGREVYLPSPVDIDRRIVDLRWMQEQGFNDSEIANVLEHDNPTLSRVKQMVERYGVKETQRRIRAFAIKTEYDG